MFFAAVPYTPGFKGAYEAKNKAKKDKHTRMHASFIGSHDDRCKLKHIQLPGLDVISGHII